MQIVQSERFKVASVGEFASQSAGEIGVPEELSLKAGKNLMEHHQGGAIL